MSSVPSSSSQKFLGTWSCDLTARHGVQLIADVHVTLHYALERSVVDSEKRLEQHFHATETPGDDSDDVSVWELIHTESEQPP